MGDGVYEKWMGARLGGVESAVLLVFYRHLNRVFSLRERHGSDSEHQGGLHNPASPLAHYPSKTGWSKSSTWLDITWAKLLPRAVAFPCCLVRSAIPTAILPCGIRGCQTVMRRFLEELCRLTQLLTRPLVPSLCTSVKASAYGLYQPQFKFHGSVSVDLVGCIRNSPRPLTRTRYQERGVR